jgi:hypothetical protein
LRVSRSGRRCIDVLSPWLGHSNRKENPPCHADGRYGHKIRDTLPNNKVVAAWCPSPWFYHVCETMLTLSPFPPLIPSFSLPTATQRLRPPLGATYLLLSLQRRSTGNDKHGCQIAILTSSHGCGCAEDVLITKGSERTPGARSLGSGHAFLLRSLYDVPMGAYLWERGGWVDCRHFSRWMGDIWGW